MALSGCFWGNEFDWADEKQIMEAGRRCGVSGLRATKAGEAWAAYVPDSVPDAKKKEDCIYADLNSQGLIVTR